jgi:hypothetical protein
MGLHIYRWAPPPSPTRSISPLHPPPTHTQVLLPEGAVVLGASSDLPGHPPSVSTAYTFGDRPSWAFGPGRPVVSFRASTVVATPPSPSRDAAAAREAFRNPPLVRVTFRVPWYAPLDKYVYSVAVLAAMVLLARQAVLACRLLAGEGGEGGKHDALKND